MCSKISAHKIVFVVLLVTSGIHLTGAHVSIAQSRSRVGLITTLTGPQALFGQEIANAIKLALRRDQGIEVVMTDDEGRPDGSAKRLAELIQRERVAAIVGPFLGGSDAAVRETLVGYGDVTLISLAPYLGQPRPRNYFRVGTSRGFLVSRASQYIREELKPSKMIIVEESGILAHGQSWAGMFPRVDIHTQQIRSTQDLQSAPGAVANAIENRMPDAILTPGSLGFAGLMHIVSSAQARSSSKVVIYSSSGIGNFNEIKSPRAFLVTAPGYQTHRGREFQEQFAKEFGRPPDLGYGYQAYAVLEILSSILHRKIPMERISQEVSTGKFETILGRIEFRANGNSNWQSEEVWRLDERKKASEGAGSTRYDCTTSDCCENCSCCGRTCKGTCSDC